MSDDAYVQAGSGGLGWEFFVYPLLVVVFVHLWQPFAYHVGHMLLSLCDRVQVPTDQTNIPISEDTTSHTGMPASPVPATRAEPSLTRADTRTREDHEDDSREIYERMQVRDSRGRYTSKRVLVRIDMT